MKSGQIISATVKEMPWIKHHGITLSEGNNNYVLHNIPFRGPVIDHLDQWLSSRNFTSLQNTGLEEMPNDIIIDRFEGPCYKDYNLIFYNCEHFIDCMTNRPLNSRQLKKFVFIVIIVFSIFLYLTNKV